MSSDGRKGPIRKQIGLGRLRQEIISAVDKLKERYGATSFSESAKHVVLGIFEKVGDQLEVA